MTIQPCCCNREICTYDPDTGCGSRRMFGDGLGRRPLGDAQGAANCGVWQPIETAPRDGTPIIGLVGNRACTIKGTQYTDHIPNGDRWFGWSEIERDAHCPCNPSKWMPFPERRSPEVPSTLRQCPICARRVASPCETLAIATSCPLSSTEQK